MELIHSPASPYARKVRILIHETGLSDAVKITEAHPMHNIEAVRAANPLGLVPVLLTRDGGFIPDSPLILDYILEKAPAHPFNTFSDDHARWQDRRLHALCDGIMDAALKRTQENLRPKELQADDWKSRWSTNILNAIDHIENTPEFIEAPFNLGQIALATALDYVSFRHGDLNWTEKAPLLNQWLTTISARASLKSTHPAHS